MISRRDFFKLLGASAISKVVRRVVPEIECEIELDLIDLEPGWFKDCCTLDFHRSSVDVSIDIGKLSEYITLVDQYGYSWKLVGTLNDCLGLKGENGEVIYFS
jgi:hypothetical protein